MGLAALLGATFIGTGCASERDPIGRVQPQALSKHFFVGENLTDASDDPEFRYRGYVVDGSASQSVLGVGSWAHIDRIKWEVTETMLIARKSYSPADGRDAKLTPGAKINDGTVVAAFPIESHFDIRRGYNTTTGEEMNIVEENSVDRPWYAREYFRVNWDKNMVDVTPMWGEFFFAKLFGDGLQMQPVQYTVTDPSDENAFHLEEENGYFDFVTKYYVDPSKSYLARWGVSLPTCALYGIFTGSGTYECDPQEAAVRWSFAKIDPNESYEPLDNTWAPEDIVGNPGGMGSSLEASIVTAPRQSYDPQYGYTDAGMHRYANVHNIWKKSHQQKADGSWVTCSANTDANVDGTADQCENAKTGYNGSKGSQCDVAMGRCTIPYRDREVKTITYWVNKETPADLLDAVDANGNPTSGPDAKGLPGFANERGTIEDLIYSWNQLMQTAPAYAKEIECRRTGDGDRAKCHGEFFSSTDDPKTKEMVSYGNWLVDVPKAGWAGSKTTLTICHNPVRPYDDHEACGDTGTTARVGDVRKNFVFYWAYDSRAPWGGIANWEGDPLTGQAWGNAAQIMGRSATYAAAMQRDIIQLAIGDIKFEDILENTPADTFFKKLQDGRMPALTQDEIDARIASIDTKNLQISTGIKPFKPTSADPELAQAQKSIDRLASKHNSTANPMLSSTAVLESDAIMNPLKGTKYEAELVDAHWATNALGVKSASDLSANILDAASPLRGLDPGKMRIIESWFETALHDRGACFLGNEAPVAGSVFLPGVAGYFKKKYAGLSAKERGEKIYQDLWKESVKGIALHEIGHSLGMFHNFASSWDAANYNPQYWQLRTNEGAATKACDAPRSADAPDSCMGPRYLDPETKDEAGIGDEPRPDVYYFGNTSTMEYQLERFAETVGLGTYDYHTMKTLYGRAVDTLDDKIIPVAQQQKNLAFRNLSQLGEREFIGTGVKHYTEAARQLKVFDAARDCRPATEQEKKTGSWRVVHGKVCSPPQRDVWSFQDFQTDCIKAGSSATAQCYSYSDGNQLTAPKWHVNYDTSKIAGHPSEKHDRVRWQYRFGQTHNAYFHANDSDAGADPYEVTINTFRRFNDSYPWAYFRRKNREYYVVNLPTRTADRYFDRVRGYHWLVATDIGRSGDLTSDDDLRPYAMAETEMVRLLSNAVLAPEPGLYGASIDRTPTDSLAQIWDSTSTADDKSGPFIGVPDGRYIAEEYDNDLGGSWDYLNFLKHPGFDVEKSMALMALVDGRPSLFTISRDNWLDGRDVKINFRNDMPNMIDRLMGGLLSEDWETIAPAYDPGTKSVNYLDLALPTPAKRPDAQNILFPNVGYKQQLAGFIWTAVFSRLNSDMTLVNKSKIWIDGALDAVALPDDQIVKFTDPDSGYTYVARKYGTETVAGKTVEKGIGSRVVAHANALATAAYETTGVVDTYGRPTYKLDSAKQPIVKDPTAAAKLTKYRGLVDAVRQISVLLTGPLGGGGGGGGGEDDSPAKK